MEVHSAKNRRQRYPREVMEDPKGPHTPVPQPLNLTFGGYSLGGLSMWLEGVVSAFSILCLPLFLKCLAITVLVAFVFLFFRHLLVFSQGLSISVPSSLCLLRESLSFCVSPGPNTPIPTTPTSHSLLLPCSGLPL